MKRIRIERQVAVVPIPRAVYTPAADRDDDDDLHALRGMLLAVLVGAMAWAGMGMLIWTLV